MMNSPGDVSVFGRWRGWAALSAWWLAGWLVAALPASAADLLWADRLGIAPPVWQEKDHTPVISHIWSPSQNDRDRGFAAGVVSTHVQLSPRWLWSEPSPSRKILAVVSPGSHGASALAVRTLDAPVAGLRWMMTDLQGEQGHVLPARCLDMRVVRYPAPVRTPHVLGHYLERHDTLDLPAHWTSWHWLTIHVPTGTPSGVYQGKLSLSSRDGQAATFDVRLRVLAYDIPLPPGAWGTFVPGHFHRPTVGSYRNFASEQWTADTMVQHFRLWRHYGLNSPFFYHVYPELAVIDGQVRATFHDLDRFAQAMRQAGIDGDMGVDLRFILRWAEVAGRALAEQQAKGQPWVGDLGVPGQAGLWRLHASREDYGPQGKDLAVQAVRQLLAHAQDNDWPRVLIMIEEELAHDDKREMYEAFKDDLIKAFPDRQILVDNMVGYGKADAIDRGQRDGLPWRQYNNWTAQAMQDARDSHAEIRAFNYGFNRAVGLYSAAHGLTGYHQWADHWGEVAGSHFWRYSAVQRDGVLGSVELARLHEGLVDLGVYHLLRSLAGSLKAAGHVELAAYAQAVLQQTVADLPVNRFAFDDWQRQLPADELALRRWRMIQAIEAARHALGISPSLQTNQAATGTSAFMHLIPWQQANGQSDDALILRAPLGQVDGLGRQPSHVWAQSGSRTASFTWMLNRLTGLRAAAGSPDEPLPVPSAAHASVAYSADGLSLRVAANHATPDNARLRHGDDDPNLWQDDCFEFFFAASPEAPHFQFIVNVAGKRVLLQSGKVLPADGVRIHTRWPINPSGGYEQEILIPWSVLGLDRMPAVGSMWEINIGREFHSWNQITTWAPVFSQFAERGAWGKLVFEASPGDVVFERLALGHGYPGLNVARGTLHAAGAAYHGGPVRVLVVDERGQARHEARLTLSAGGKAAFELPYQVPLLANTTAWRLDVRDGQDRLLNRVPMPLLATASPLVVSNPSVLGQTGTPVMVDLSARVGELSASQHQLQGRWVSEQGQVVVEIPPKPLPASGPLRVWMDTSGLSPGKWTLTLWITGLQSSSKAEAKVELLPAI